MARLDAVMAEQLGPPDTFAKKMRRAYLMFFAPSVICAAAVRGVVPGIHKQHRGLTWLV